MGKGPWTGQEINTLVSMWPNASMSQIGTRLHRSYGCVRSKAIRLREMGLLEAKKTRRPSPIKPALTDFDKVKMDYCRKHNMTTAQLFQGFKTTTSLGRSCIGWLWRPGS